MVELVCFDLAQGENFLETVAERVFYTWRAGESELDLLGFSRLNC